MRDWWVRWGYGLVCAFAIAVVCPAAAQAPAEADRLNAEVTRLYQAGKYAEAIPLARRALALSEKALGSEHLDVAQSLNNLAVLYASQGRYAEAEPMYKRLITILEKALGPGHPEVATLLNNLAELYRLQGLYAEAEPLSKRSLAIREWALGPQHHLVAMSLNNLGSLYSSQGRYAEAEPLFKRALSIGEKVLEPEHPDLSKFLNNLAELCRLQGRYPEAEPLYKRSLALREKALGPEHPDVATSLNNLALLYQAQGSYAQAEPRYKRSLSIREMALGPEHPHVAQTLDNLAGLYATQGRFTEAEPLLKRSLQILEKALGPEDPTCATSLNNLGHIYDSQGRHEEAELLYQRALAINRAALGPEHPNVATSLNNLATWYEKKGRYAEAEPLFKRSLEIFEKVLGLGHRDVAGLLTNLGSLYIKQGRYPEAEPLLNRSLAIFEKAVGPTHPLVATSLNNIVQWYHVQGRFPEAETLSKRSLEIAEQTLGPEHPDVATSLNNLAVLAISQSNLAGAADRWRRATALIQRRAERGLGDATIASGGESHQKAIYFQGLIKATHHLAANDIEKGSRAAREMFESAQWAMPSDAAASVAQMAARSAGGSTELAALVRERQDVVAEWSAKDKQLIAARSEAPTRRNAAAEKLVTDRLTEIDARLTAIDAIVARDFPDYAALESPKPSSVADVQAALRADEALVLFLDTDARNNPLPDETFVWVVTKTDARWVRSDFGTLALAREVAALRCGLDATAWRDEGEANCQRLTGTNFTVADIDAQKPLPFDVARAHALYKALFGDIADLIKGKHLLLVPSGPLTQLPFQVLVAEPPSGGDYKTIRWLARDHAITVLPAVSSLKALRQNAKVSRASEAFIGFGNPVLDGNPKCGTVVIPDRCPDEADPTASATTFQRLFATANGFAKYFTRAGQADVAEVRKLCPLPDTAHELRCVAKSLGATSPQSIVLGRSMTEAAIKLAPLNRFRVVHFATHGLLAGETQSLAKGLAEPALVFTPPSVASEADDGLLTASEIATLKLDADWVVMSACNTAGASGGADGGGEALSGLARAFFYAGARALLVSHWEVNSYAATMLTSTTFAELRRDPSLGRAEALQRAMLQLMSDPRRNWAAHPSVWAPFVVVGEGGSSVK